ncbi:MAG: hypothetical protein ACLP07_16600 [Terracidiphilus sp.]
MKIRDRVCRKDVPGIHGTVIAMRDGQAKCYWSSHTSQWIDTAALMLVPRMTQKGKP